MFINRSVNDLRPKKHLILQWHITERCDHNCAHCYMYDSRTYSSEKSYPSEMDLSQCRLVIRQFVELCKNLKFLTGINFQPKFIVTGGDPLLHKDIFKIIQEIRKYSDQIEILGNGDHLTNQIARKLFDYGVKRYQISLDGLKKRHDSIRGKGSFEKAFNGIKILSSAGIITAVMFTLFKDNMEDLCPLIEKVVNENVNIFSFARISSFGNARDITTCIPPGEYRNLLAKVYLLQTSLKKDNNHTCFYFKDHLWTLFLHEIGIYKTYPHYKSGKTVAGCHMAQSFMVLLSDGTALACRRFYSPIGRFPDQKLSDIFLHSKEMIKYRNVKSLKKCAKCNLFYYCRGCPAVAYGYNGDWREADPQCWKKI